MEILIFGHAGPRLLVFPTRKQRFYEYEDYGMVHSLRHRLEAGDVQLVCLDGIDEESLYCFEKPPEERIRRHLQYERYVLDEVLPFSAKRSPGTSLTAHGCSLGAYHAVSMALRYPEHFQRVLAFSGRYDLTLHAGEYHSLFHGYESPELDRLTPTAFLPKVRAPRTLKQLRKLSFQLVIGEDDPFCPNNAGFAHALAAKKIPHQLHVWCGNAHRFRYWRQMIRVYLEPA